MPAESSIASVSDLFVYSAVAFYSLALLAYAAESARMVTMRASVPIGAAPQTSANSAGQGEVRTVPDSLIGRFADVLTVMGFVCNLGGIVARGLAAQRAPWGNMYEFTIVIAAAMGAAYLTLLSRRPIRSLGVWVVTMIVLALGVAITLLYTPVDALVPVLNSYWLVIHVAAAITAGGIFTVGAVATALSLVRGRFDKADADGRPRRYAASLPTQSTLAQVAHGAHMFAFPVWTFAVLAGAIWAENSWGRYWGWDPKETWAFITWVLYAAYLHADSTPGWRGRRASWLAMAGYAAFLFNFFGVNLWITGLHSYAGV